MAARSEHPDYEILELCGEGGNGVVYRARDRRLNRIVALKFLRAQHRAALARFRHEAEAIAALNHPAIATIFEAGEWDGEPFLALEYLPGGTLAHRTEAAQFSPAQILDYVRQLGSGLEYAHSKGILHRDIKPSNCMFSAHGTLKLVDFGLAKSSDGDDYTEPGAVVGTIPYMAPELLQGEHASVKTDLYALGAVVYELAAGHTMYRRTETASITEQVLKGVVVPLEQLRPDLPASFRNAISRATARRAADRYSTVREFQDALTRSATWTAGLPEPTETLTLSVKAARNRWKLWLPILLVVMALAMAAYLVRDRLAPAAPTETLLVLPFENLGRDPADQALSDGLQETATSILSSAAELRQKYLIIPSSEVRKREIRTISDARKQFNATEVLTGTTQRTAQNLQLTLNLTDARLLREKDSRVVMVATDQTANLQRLLAENLGSLLVGKRLTAVGAGVAGQTTSSSEAYNLFLRGRGALEDRDLDHAVEFFSQALKADPAFVLPRAKLAEAYLRLNLATKDSKWLAKADSEIAKAALDGQTIDVLMPQAMIQKATGKTEEAIRTFRKLLVAEPGNIEALRYLAEALDAVGRSKEAEETFRQGLKLRPGYWPLYESLGDLYSRHHDYVKATESLSAGLELAGESHSLHYNLGATYFRMSRWDDAVREFERSIALKPTAPAYANLGTVRFFQGNYAESAAQCEHAAQLQPANAVNWGNLGDALWQIPGKRAQAQKAFDRAASLAGQKLSINPNDARTRKSYALYLAKLGRLGEAVDQAKRAIEQAPNDENVHFYAARVFVLKGDTEAALTELEKCVALGYNPQEIGREPDFIPLRADGRYRRLIETRK